MSEFREITNQKLRLEDIPGDSSGVAVLEEFALTFNGYDEFPDSENSESCAEIANSRDHESLSRVRACLFYEQRRSRHSDIGWDDSYVRELLALIRKYVHNTRYRLPGVKGKNGATIVDLLGEVNALCEANIETIRRVCQFNAKREVRDEINRRLRHSHNILGMAAGSRRFGCLYVERNLDEKLPFVVEHAIPVSALVKLYESGTSFIDLVFMPIALISQLADKKLNMEKLSKSGHDQNLEYVLLRYAKAKIMLETYDGVPVNASTWTMDDHLKLIARTCEINDVYEAIRI
jgi:hypothetical protein